MSGYYASAVKQSQDKVHLMSCVEEGVYGGNQCDACKKKLNIKNKETTATKPLQNKNKPQRRVIKSESNNLGNREKAQQ